MIGLIFVILRCAGNEIFAAGLRYIPDMRFFLLLPAFLAGMLILSCERETEYTDPGVLPDFSEDTVYFDTVFTSLGTTTQQLRVYNHHDRTMKLDAVYLAGGDQSVFRLNIDGAPVNMASNIEIPPEDSIYIFIEATLDPNNMDSLLVVQDSIVFMAAGNSRDVDLIAWGQDVHFFGADTIGTRTWVNDKPYLVFNYVLIEPGAVLTIEEGTRVHFHKNAVMVVDGSLRVKGSKEQPVVFQGDRLEQLYRDIPGQWHGIWMRPGSHDNTIDHALIRNGTIGLEADTLADLLNPTLKLTNTVIQNMSYFGLFGLGSTIEAANCVISKCGQASVALLIEGSYSFYHCTLANYWSGFSNRSVPALYLQNYYKDIDGNIQVRGIDRAYFGNCIIYGNMQYELGIDMNPNGPLNYRFDHCLTKFDPGSEYYDLQDTVHFTGLINGTEPEFADPAGLDYTLDSLSPAIDAGQPGIAAGWPLDLNGASRLSDAGPDLGAYEWTGPDSLQ